MAANLVDLWGDFEVTPTRTPASIMREQAAILSKKTNGLVLAEVENHRYGNGFSYSLYLLVPALEDYRFSLLSISHQLELYPVEARSTGPSVELTNENQFVEWLATCLSSPETKKTIANLISLAQA